MPFTFSHPAIALPLVKKHSKLLSSTGLIIGSLTPDFESFITFGDDKIYGHAWKGVIWYDMPLAFFLAFLFHLVIRNSLIDNLPLFVRERFTELRRFDWLPYFKKNVVVVLVSLFIGIMSHMLWDAFTHLNLRYPDAKYSQVTWQNHRVYIILQYFCSMVGLLWLAFYIFKMPREHVVKSKIGKGKYWILVFIIASLITYYKIVSIPAGYWAGFADVINYCISGVFYGLLIMSVIKIISNHYMRKVSIK